MENTIKISQSFVDTMKINEDLKKMNENQASNYVKGNFRAEVFNLKSYLTDSKDKDQILYIPINIVSLVSGGFADFVIGDGVEVEISDEKAQAKWNEIAESNDFNGILYNMAVEQSVYGYANARVRKNDEEEIIIEQVPYEYYFPNLDDVYLGEQPHKIYIVSRNVKSELGKLVDGSETAKIQVISEEGIGYRIEIGMYKKTTNVTPEWTLTEELSSDYIEFRNIYTVHNKKIGSKILGVSDFIDAIDLIQELNDRLTQISVQFIKHLNSKISMPAGLKKFLDTKSKSIDDLEVLVHPSGERPAEYIENKNSLISEAIDYLDKLLMLLSAVLQVPNSFLGMEEGGGAEKVEALKIKMIRFLKKINRKQSSFEKVIKRLVQDVLVFSGDKGEYEITVKFSDKDLEDSQVKFDNYITMFDKKLLSRQSAIGYLLDWDKKNVEAEITLLKEEEFVIPAVIPDDTKK